MLVLTRKQNEKIQISDNITITVLRMKGKAVRLGIEAPSNINVLRGELVFDLPDETPRHRLEVGQAAKDRWPIEKSEQQATPHPLQGLSSPPLATMVNARNT